MPCSTISYMDRDAFIAAQKAEAAANEPAETLAAMLAELETSAERKQQAFGEYQKRIAEYQELLSRYRALLLQ